MQPQLGQTQQVVVPPAVVELLDKLTLQVPT